MPELPASDPIVVTREGLSLAGLAFMEACGPPNRRMEEAIAAYLWAEQNAIPIFADCVAYPSLSDLRAFLAEYRARKAAEDIARADREDRNA